MVYLVDVPLQLTVRFFVFDRRSTVLANVRVMTQVSRPQMWQTNRLCIRLCVVWNNHVRAYICNNKTECFSIYTKCSCAGCNYFMLRTLGHMCCECSMPSVCCMYTFEFHHLIRRLFPMVLLNSRQAIVVPHQHRCAVHLYLHTFAQRQAHYGPRLDKIFVNWHHRRRLCVQMNLYTEKNGIKIW